MSGEPGKAGSPTKHSGGIMFDDRPENSYELDTDDMSGRPGRTTTSPERRHKRFRKSCEVEFRLHNGTFRGISEDFSIDGLQIRTDNLPFPGATVSITVYLPDGSASELKGRVRRVTRACDNAAGDASQRTFRGSVGIEIIEKDYNYMMFFMSLLGTIKN
jgi:hypothetical protein